ncbi:MAG TPA: hypothetical protein VNX26_18325 [Candidatus Acidoferrum sp.]|jgi:hypothetical protein|nr:hypothetical protein [Candidatus Acidoferrum sp.]
MKRIAHITFGLTVLITLLISLAAAQTSTSSVPPGQTSLGDYARKIRKDPAAPKAKPKLFDNDNLPTDDKLSVVGQKPSTEAANTAPADDKVKADAATKPAEDDQAAKQAALKDWQTKLNAQKDAIDLAARELDVLQREYQLRAAAMYADAGNRIRNSAQWDKQDAEYKQKIADKQKAIDDAKQKLDDMKEEARKAGVPSSMLD